MKIHEHGKKGAVVIVLHGGPAAFGAARGLALALADEFRVIEPWEQGSGDEPLTVARHVADLHKLVKSASAEGKPALAGHSWGAMLALAYAAENPDSVSPIVLVGCGTFDEESRARMKQIRTEQMPEETRKEIERLQKENADPEKILRKQYEVFHHIDHYDPLPPGKPDPEIPPFDMKAHTETWEDMVRLQKEGAYPAAFSAIKCPVIMLHGVHDPHPGRMIYKNLKTFIPQLEYREFECCGHEPWNEKHAREDFLMAIKNWLKNNN